jgi:CRP/FNR family cyclic AMP-dependent transcriptional regulator
MIARGSSGYWSPYSHVATINPGQMFGELALTIGLDRTATASTMGGREVLVLPAASVNLKFDQADPFLRYWIEYLMERVVDLSSRID